MLFLVRKGNSAFKTFFIFTILLLLGVNTSGQSLKRIKHFGKNPGHLKMYLHVPPAVDKSKAAPLIVVLHGCLQCPGSVAKLSGWNKLADEQGFYTMYPGQRITNNPQKCFKWYRKRHITKNKGESLSIKNMIDYLKVNYNIDSNQVFITGLSAGAAMSVAMMANYPKTFNSGAIFAGVPYKAGTSLVPLMLTYFGWRIKSPEKWAELVRQQNRFYSGNYPKIIIYQGSNDWVVNKRNAVELMKQWTALHQISTTPSETVNSFLNNPNIDRSSYSDKENSEKVIFYKVNKLSHALLVNPGKCSMQGGRHSLFSKDMNYHSTYWTAVDFGLIKSLSISGEDKVAKNQKALVYSVPQMENATYIWSVPMGCNIFKGNSTNKIEVNWGSLSGNINVTAIDANGCIKQYPTKLIKVIE